MMTDQSSDVSVRTIASLERAAPPSPPPARRCAAAKRQPRSRSFGSLPVPTKAHPRTPPPRPPAPPTPALSCSVASRDRHGQY
eukprot:1182484-Prorocentrum_minimum.AAC.5